jgi:hypothetical protein
MDRFAVSHFSDRALLHDLKSLVAHDRRTTAVLLTRIAEVEERQLYRQAAYDSMFAYCLHELHFSEDAAYRHLNAARVARRFPAVLVALAEGRLHVRAVLMLARHLTSGNADQLVAAATYKTRAEIEILLAQRFPRRDLPERLQVVPSPPAPTPVTMQPAPERVGQLAPERVEAMIPNPSASRPAPQLAPERVDAPAPRPRVTPLAPERFGLQVTLDQETYDLLQQARALMGHPNPAGEIVPVLKSALQLFVGHLEKRKFAATARPGHARPSASARHIPAAVKRAVWERDGGRCTFTSDGGQRCPARRMLEFDHREPVARGGEATAENLRLVCRSHNQHAAERTFGAAFMERKREAAKAERGRAAQRAGRRGGGPDALPRRCHAAAPRP